MKRTLENGEKISDEFNVLLEIYKITEIDKKTVCYSQLCEKMKDDCDKNVIGRTLERAYDKGMTDERWENIDGVYSRNVYIDDRFLGFIKGLYNSTKIASSKKEKLQDDLNM